MVDPNVLIGMVALVSLALLGWVGFAFAKYKQPWARGPLSVAEARALAEAESDDEDDDAQDDA